MHIGKIIFSQVMEHLPMHTFRRCVQRYDGNHNVKSFNCLAQFLCMAFAQLTYRESLVYVLVAIIKNRLQLETELYTILQILSLTLFEKNRSRVVP